MSYRGYEVKEKSSQGETKYEGIKFCVNLPFFSVLTVIQTYMTWYAVIECSIQTVLSCGEVSVAFIV